MILPLKISKPEFFDNLFTNTVKIIQLKKIWLGPLNEYRNEGSTLSDIPRDLKIVINWEPPFLERKIIRFPKIFHHQFREGLPSNPWIIDLYTNL